MADLYYYYSWDHVPDIMIPNIFAEFRANGVEHIVFSHKWMNRILREPAFFPPLMKMARDAGVSIGEMHAPWGAAYDLNCSDKARRANMIRDHKTAMAYAVDAGCKTYTMHVGAYSWVFEHIPLEKLRGLALEALECLIPEAESLGLVIAVENSYEPPNSAPEVLNLLSRFKSPALGCCFDTGHACLMAPFESKQTDKYFGEIHDAWWEGIKECSNSFELLRPHIVTAHMHDNDGYSDAHRLPGCGRIDWTKQISELKSCPRLISLQTEVRTIPDGPSIKLLAETFTKLMAY